MNEFSASKFESGDDKEYKIEAIWDSAIYAKEVDKHLPGLYYLVAWKGYPEEENSWELSLTVIQLRKMISTFYKDYPEKLTAISVPQDSALLMAKPTIQLSMKQKQGQLIEHTKKCTKWGDKEKSKSVWF